MNCLIVRSEFSIFGPSQKTAVSIGLRIVGFAKTLFKWWIWAILFPHLILDSRPCFTDSKDILGSKIVILNIQATIIIFIRSIKVQNWKWWCADRHRFSFVIRFESYAILVEMHLKFSLFLELLQNCLLLTIIYIEPLNWLEFFKLIRFYFYCRQDWFWNNYNQFRQAAIHVETILTKQQKS